MKTGLRHGAVKTLACCLITVIGLSACSRKQPPADRERPNILLIYTDDQSAFTVGAYGNPDVHTPNMDRLAEEGMRFTRAYCNAAVCGPARDSLLTGLYPHQHGRMINQDDMHPLEPIRTYLPRELGKAGYHTAGFGKWHSRFAPTASMAAQTPSGVARDNAGFHVWVPSNRHKEGQEQEIVKYLHARRHDARPWFIYCAFNHPHMKWEAPEAYHALYDPAKFHLPPNMGASLQGKPEHLRRKQALDLETFRKIGIAPTDYRRMLADYYAETSYLDAKVGVILDTLRELGMAGHTLVIFTSDQGNLAGHHGLYFKGPMVYEEFVRVPMMVRWPGHLKGGRTTDVMLNATVDIAPTILDAAGVAAPRQFAGRSFLPLLKGERYREADFVVLQIGAMNQGKHARLNAGRVRMLRTRRWKLGMHEGDADELYDMEADPYELHNLASDPAYSARYARMKGMLMYWMKAHDDRAWTCYP